MPPENKSLLRSVVLVPGTGYTERSSVVRQQTFGGQQTGRDDEIKVLSKLASLSRMYTNHTIRATAITLWSHAQVPSRDIMAISRHRSEASLRNYNARPSSGQLRACSNIHSGELNGRVTTPESYGCCRLEQSSFHESLSDCCSLTKHSAAVCQVAATSLKQPVAS